MNIFYFPNSPDESSKAIDFIIQVIASLIGAGAAVGVYWHSNKKAKEKEEENKARFEKDKLRYLHQLLIGSKKFIDSFINGLEKFVDDLKAEPINIGSIHISTNEDVKRITNKINQEEHFHAYKNQLKNSRITELFNTIDYFNNYETNVVEHLKEKKIRNQNSIMDFVAGLEEIRDLLIKYLQDMYDSNQSVQSPFFLVLNQLKEEFGNLNENHPGNHVLMKNGFLIPLSIALYNYQNTTGDNSYRELLTKCAFNKSKLENHIRNNSLLADNLHKDLLNLKEAANSFRENMLPFNDFIERINFPAQ